MSKIEKSKFKLGQVIFLNITIIFNIIENNVSSKIIS